MINHKVILIKIQLIIINFNINIFNLDPVGFMEGYISFDNLPVPCQMWGGYHQDNEIHGAAPLTTGLYTFPNIK